MHEMNLVLVTEDRVIAHGKDPPDKNRGSNRTRLGPVAKSRSRE